MNMEYEGEQPPVVTTVIEAVDGAGTPVSFTIVMGPQAANDNKILFIAELFFKCYFTSTLPALPSRV